MDINNLAPFTRFGNRESTMHMHDERKNPNSEKGDSRKTMREITSAPNKVEKVRKPRSNAAVRAQFIKDVL